MFPCRASSYQLTYAPQLLFFEDVQFRRDYPGFTTAPSSRSLSFLSSFFFFLFFTFASPWMDGHDRRVSERSTLPFIRLVTFFRVNVPSSFEASHCGSCASLHVARSRPARESNLARIFLPLVEGRIYERTPTRRGTRAPRHSDTTDTTVHALLLLCLPSSRRIKGRLSCLSITSLPLHLLTFLFFCSIF